MDVLGKLFPGVGTFLAMEPELAFARIALIVLGFVLAYMGFKRKLEPLIMVPMGLGMLCVNAGILFLSDGSVGNMFLDPLVSDPVSLINIMQVNFLQPVYNLLFSNGLIACLVFMGIGARSEISFLLARPWTSMTIALFAELGTFAALAVGILVFHLSPGAAAAVATIGGADGPTALYVGAPQPPVCRVAYSGLRFQPVEQVTWVPIFPWESGEDRTVSLEKTQ